ncbi:hypothetical protein QYE76_013722 [Lolium multiflorum]|uniref:Reverse transcriptase domain-containing protein n=1 Tax=Lolium multiflorum TaxID=4521 RepID=A0AAD8X665_LOLMU|nr:hypothetical protein QYE76_013722 [Lolium multiflorum]
MDMAFGRFHFRVGKEGSHRLAISDSSRSVAAGSDSSGSASSFESGDEEISSTISTKPASSGELVKIFSNVSVGSSADSNISSDLDSVDTFDFIDRSTSVREVFADLYDGVTNINDNQASAYHQVYVIGEASRAEPETSEAFDELGNPYVDPADLTRGLGTKYIGPEPREKVQLPQEAWDRAARAMDGTEPMNTTATVAELQAYHYKKFDGLQDPKDWLVDYLETVKLTGGTKIRLKEEDEVKTTFITPYGMFCYRTMPFGLKNAGATYQRMMQKCLATQIGKNVQVYIGDVFITTKKGSTLIDDLRETFNNLDKFCLKLNPTKCSFDVPAGELLGFLVSARGIEANQKIQAIVTMPTKLKEIQLVGVAD